MRQASHNLIDKQADNVFVKTVIGRLGCLLNKVGVNATNLFSASECSLDETEEPVKYVGGCYAALGY